MKLRRRWWRWWGKALGRWQPSGRSSLCADCRRRALGRSRAPHCPTWSMENLIRSVTALKPFLDQLPPVIKGLFVTLTWENVLVVLAHSVICSSQFPAYLHVKLDRSLRPSRTQTCLMTLSDWWMQRYGLMQAEPTWALDHEDLGTSSQNCRAVRGLTWACFLF